MSSISVVPWHDDGLALLGAWMEIAQIDDVLFATLANETGVLAFRALAYLDTDRRIPNALCGGIGIRHGVPEIEHALRE
jgi:hypothetical protein